jgi:hypothetical protein
VVLHIGCIVPVYYGVSDVSLIEPYVDATWSPRCPPRICCSDVSRIVWLKLVFAWPTSSTSLSLTARSIIKTPMNALCIGFG